MGSIAVTQLLFRVVAGGQQKDFPVEEGQDPKLQEDKAMRYLQKQLKSWTHASIKKMYYFRRIEDDA